MENCVNWFSLSLLLFLPTSNALEEMMWRPLPMSEGSSSTFIIRLFFLRRWTFRVERRKIIFQKKSTLVCDMNDKRLLNKDFWCLGYVVRSSSHKSNIPNIIKKCVYTFKKNFQRFLLALDESNEINEKCFVSWWCKIDIMNKVEPESRIGGWQWAKERERDESKKLKSKIKKIF